MHPLLNRLLAEHGQRLPAETFLQAALHDREHGYYARRAAIGSASGAGDFTTAGQFHPALAIAIARWASRHRRSVLNGNHWHVIEVGPGTGALAGNFCRHLPWRARRGLHYHLVESSPVLMERQQQLLGTGSQAARRWPLGFKIAFHWHRDLVSALEHAGGAALIFSNELVDAFPAVLLRATGSQWQEIFLEPHGDTLREVAADCRADVASRLARYPASVWDSPWRDRPSQQVEIHLAYAQWWESWAAAFARGRLLTIDYGNHVEQLYHRRPRGTLRAYFHRQRFEGASCFERFGQQDLTCDVNFTDLEQWGSQLGFANLRLATQAEFIAEFWPPATRLARRDLRLAFLLDPARMGEAVQVLEQGREG